MEMEEKTLQDMTLEELSVIYKNEHPENKDVYNAIKNDAEKIIAKINEFRSEKAKLETKTLEEDEDVVKDEEIKSDKDVVIKKEEKAKLEKVEGEFKKEKTVRDIQHYYGFTNDEMYEVDLLKDKYGLQDEEIKLVSKFIETNHPEVDVNFSIYELPDYLLVHVRKYGITSKDMKAGSDKLKELLSVDESLKKEEKEKIIHQLLSYYNKLEKEAIILNGIQRKETYLQ